MDASRIVLIPVYLLIAVIIWRVIRLDAWLKPLIDEYRSPGRLEKRLAELESRIAQLEGPTGRDAASGSADQPRIEIEPTPATAANDDAPAPIAIDPTIVRRERILVLGVLTPINPGSESGETFTAIWRDFERRRRQIEPRSVDRNYYGVSFPRNGENSLEYLAGVSVVSIDRIPDGLVVREIPAATYAVFACPVSAIGATYQSIFGRWRSQVEHVIDASAPAFEQYPPANDTDSPVLIHIPIRIATNSDQD